MSINNLYIKQQQEELERRIEAAQDAFERAITTRRWMLRAMWGNIVGFCFNAWSFIYWLLN